MSGEVVTWVALGATVTAILSILTFWTRYPYRITAAEASAKAAILAAALQVKLEGVEKEFADYREAAALKFVSDRDMSRSSSVSPAWWKYPTRYRGMTERLDRVLSQRAA